jgi:hypothetical protein
MRAPDAATAAAWGDTPPARQAKIRKFTPWTNQARTVLGFLSIELPSGMILNDCKVMVGPNGTRWIALPAVKQTDAQGNPRTDANGRPVWNHYVEFRDRATRERFQAPVIEVLRQTHPQLFDGEGGR